MLWYLVSKGPGCSKTSHICIVKSSKQRIIQPRLSLVLRLRNSGVQLTFVQGAMEFIMCQACVRSLLASSGQPNEIGIIGIPILLMNKLKSREVGCLVQENC